MVGFLGTTEFLDSVPRTPGGLENLTSIRCPIRYCNLMGTWAAHLTHTTRGRLMNYLHRRAFNLTGSPLPRN